ncbi:MAG: hypothetical protein OHK0022_39160 [Roseiflexaceae bacterium]
MANILTATIDGLLLRCPRCHQGRMFRSLFDMNTECPTCGLRFESASGEITGGMVINLVVTEVVAVVLGAYFALFTTAPLTPILLALGFFTIVFPILFYRCSRGIWAGFLYVTGDNSEGD